MEVQAHFDDGALAKTAAGGDEYTRTLTTFIDQLRQVSPNVAFYIFEGAPLDNGLTQHTMLLLTSFSEDLGEITPAQWIPTTPSTAPSKITASVCSPNQAAPFPVPATSDQKEPIVSLRSKRLLTFGVIIVIAAAAGYFLPGMFLSWLLTGEVFS